MFQTVDSDFESSVIQHMPQCVRDPVFTFRHKIEAGTEAVLHFEILQTLDARQTFAAFDVVCENQSEAFAIWPARPSGRCAPGFRVDGPDVGKRASAATGPPPPQ
jgi:hypothetical protein